MLHLTFGRSKYVCPQAWQECRPSEVAALLPFALLLPEQRTEELELLLCQTWLGASEKQFRTWRMARFQWGHLRQQFQWVFERPSARPFASFTHEGTDYLTPRPEFADSTALDLAWANMKFLEFAHPTDPRPEALDELVATLCRPRRADLDEFRRSPQWNGDEREPFNEQRVQERAASLKTLEYGYKLAVLLFFEYEMKGFLETYGELFGGTGQREPRYAGGIGWVMMLKNVAKEGHFGPFDQVCQQPAHLVWSAALDDALDAQEQADQQTQTERV